MSKSEQEPQLDEYEYLPGVVEVRSEFDVKDPRQRREFKKTNREPYQRAKILGRDLVAYTKGREIRILIGVGIAVAGLKGGVALYKHFHNREK